MDSINDADTQLNHKAFGIEEGLWIGKDGAEIWVEVASFPQVDSEGAAIEFVQIVKDITARKFAISEANGQIDAINRSQSVIHFSVDGSILMANDQFLSVVGYSLNEVRGQHHRMFVSPSEANSSAYQSFWASLAEGNFQSGEYKRIAKDGREVWLQATYNPIFDTRGRLIKVVKYATDVTEQRLCQANYEGQIAAIHKSQGVITFDLNGIILDANPMFLKAMGYELDEIIGRHHRIFVDTAYAHGNTYAMFWEQLGRGLHQKGEFKRLCKDGSDVWLHATYNPIFDLNGRPYKIVKYATVSTWEKLRQADHQGQIAAIHKAQCVISFNLDGTILDANDNFLDAMGYRLGDVQGRHHRMFVDDDTSNSADYETFWQKLAQGKHQAGAYKRIAKDGQDIWLQASYNPIFDMSGRPFKIVKYATNVTHEWLRQADHEGQIAAIHKSQGVIAFELDGIVLDANENFLTALGYDLHEIKGRHHRMFVEPGHGESADYAEFWNRLREGSFVTARYKRIGKNGREVWIQASYNPIFDLNGKPFKVIKLATDVTADVAVAADLTLARQQAQHDAATALPNRVKLASFMSAALHNHSARVAARVAVFYMDLDFFKPINDKHGHHVGDMVLGEVANRLRRGLGADQIVARVGGDEFVLAAPNLTDDQIESLCLRLQTAVAHPIYFEEQELSVGLSIGVAVSPADGTTADDLIQSADAALYRSKQNGRGIYSFHTKSKNDQLEAKRAFAQDMRRGLTAREFFLEYQPRFDITTRRVQGVEALVRWAHPKLGRINPADFIAVAEKNGLINELGEWVLRTACNDATRWPEISLSVNVSPVQFASGRLMHTVLSVLRETKMAPARLELEITESVLLENAERARQALQELKSCGVRLAMDDFGTGYASLSYLRDFPFDAMKIDRRFVADIEHREGGRAIVQAILKLGKALGLSVTAEGVETPGQLLLLRIDDCSEVQGFLLARPMSAEAITTLLDKAPYFAEIA